MLESDREFWEKTVLKRNPHAHENFYDEIKRPMAAKSAGKAAYIKRNYRMIDDSDIILMYYREDYLPTCKYGSNEPLKYTTNSGTRIALDYAKSKNKKIIII